MKKYRGKHSIEYLKAHFIFNIRDSPPSSPLSTLIYICFWHQRVIQRGVTLPYLIARIKRTVNVLAIAGISREGNRLTHFHHETQHTSNNQRYESDHICF
jgi:hypothetical protein